MSKTKEVKRKEAEERLEKWQALTPKQQLLSLDKRKMKAKKQRFRIESQL